MLQYILKRLLLSIFTLWVISLVAFGISQSAAGDPVEVSMNKGEDTGGYSDVLSIEAYKNTAKSFGLDKPPFYGSLAPAAYPDTLYRIFPRSKRRLVRQWIRQYGNWEEISVFFQQGQALEQKINRVADRYTTDSLIQLRNTYQRLKYAYQKEETAPLMERLARLVSQDSLLGVHFKTDNESLQQAYLAIFERQDRSQIHLPAFKWYGFDNQYHNWIKSMLSGEMGLSYVEKRPVSHKLNEAIWITIQMNLLALLLAFLLAIPIGVYAARKRGQSFDKTTTLLLFFLYSIPTFWIATMALIFLTTSEYGMDLFPSMGLGMTAEDASYWTKLSTRIQHLILPVLCIAVGGLAFIVRQVRSSMQEVLQQDYIRTARAKGLPEKKVIWRHGFRNALFPLITLVANILPALITGSIVIERIFNIPGMGFVTIEAIFQRDWPVVYAVLMIGAVLTVIGILLSDVLYAITDPRVKFK
jgi:peptide/nickel transport system permease protein